MLGTCLLDDEAALSGFPDEHSNSNCNNKGHDCKGEGRSAPGNVAGLERKREVAAQDDRHGLASEDERLPQTADINSRLYTQSGAWLLPVLSLKTPALIAYARLLPEMTATASPVNIRACPRLHTAARVLKIMAHVFTAPTNAQPSILNLDGPMPECAVEALYRTGVWEGLTQKQAVVPKGAFSRACMAEGQLT